MGRKLGLLAQMEVVAVGPQSETLITIFDLRLRGLISELPELDSG